MLPVAVLLDIFPEILDYLGHEDIDDLGAVFPCVVRMYKSCYLDLCFTFPHNMYVECSYCNKIDKGKYRKGVYICRDCTTKMISIPIF